MKKLSIEVLDFKKSKMNREASQIILSLLENKGFEVVYKKRNIEDIDKIWKKDDKPSYCISSQERKPEDTNCEVYLFIPPDKLMVKPFDSIIEMLLIEQETDGREKPIVEALKEEDKKNGTEELVSKSSFATIRRLFKCSECCGYDSKEILEAKHRLYLIPRILIDYYLELGANDVINRTHDRLLAPNELRLTEKYLIFYEQSEQSGVWGIHRRDLKKKNPPVYFVDNEFDTVSWKLDAETLTDFFDTMAYTQAIFALEYCCENVMDISPTEAEYVREKFRMREKRFLNWSNIEFLGNYRDSIIALIPKEGRYEMIYASSDEKHYYKMHKVLSRLGR